MKNESKKIKIKGIPFGVLLAGKVADGTKTVTRRVVKHPAVDVGLYDRCEIYGKRALFCHAAKIEAGITGGWPIMDIPYKVGQLLYVREPWRVDGQYDKPNGSAHIPDGEMVYWNGDAFPFGGWQRLARFMPARFSRTFLRVTEVRCERLGGITEVDAVREGIDVCASNDLIVLWRDYSGKVGFSSPTNSFFSLWDSINGKDSHLQNPWVWVISFERVEMPNPWNLDSPWTPSWTKCDSEWLYGNRDHVLGCDYAITVAFDGFMLWDWSVSICGKVTDEGHAGSDDEAKSNAVKAYRKSSKGIAPHLL